MIKIKVKKQKKVKKWKNYKSDKSAKVTKVTKVTKWHKWHKWQTWQKWNKVKQGCTHKNTSHIFCTPTLKSAPSLLCLFGSLVSLVSLSRRFLLKNIIFQWFFLHIFCIFLTILKFQSYKSLLFSWFLFFRGNLFF